MIQTNSLRVRVTRYWHDSMSQGFGGVFDSDVYAIRDNEFLVYDDGSGDSFGTVRGFRWVDFTELMPVSPRGALYDDAEEYEPTVKLIYG